MLLSDADATDPKFWWSWGGLRVSALASKLSSPSLSPGLRETLCFVLGQNILLSQCLSPPRCLYGNRQI